jgi:hypothetical protein
MIWILPQNYNTARPGEWGDNQLANLTMEIASLEPTR